MIECSEEMLKKFVLELKREGLFKDKRLNAFQKTEQLLYKYNDFADAIKSKEEQIKELKDFGLKKQSKSITKYGAGSGEVKTDADKLDEKIQVLENTIDDTKRYIKIIDDSLEKLNSDKFFEIIKMKYFKGMTLEEIGFEFDVEGSTISRNKNRLIKKLSIQLFPDEALNEMLS
jgi:RNA polymerase sigma factor (sigma-70 family)